MEHTIDWPWSSLSLAEWLENRRRIYEEVRRIMGCERWRTLVMEEKTLVSLDVAFSGTRKEGKV
jgi:hypothetical protein